MITQSISSLRGPILISSPCTKCTLSQRSAAGRAIYNPLVHFLRCLSLPLRVTLREATKRQTLRGTAPKSCSSMKEAKIQLLNLSKSPSRSNFAPWSTSHVNTSRRSCWTWSAGNAFPTLFETSSSPFWSVSASVSPRLGTATSSLRKESKNWIRS